jgi:predicted membrane-bound spermidine synthase
LKTHNTISSFRQRVLLLVFFFSGFAALLYQVVWQRWLVFYTGISSLSISLIVSAFMAGLGLGYLVGGNLADRSAKNKPILYFVFAELGIGLFALLSKPIIYDFLYNSGIFKVSGNAQTYLVLFGVLLFPTFLMGLSLPLLSKAFKLQSIDNQASFISKLYFVNTLGAACGAFVTGIILIRWIGFQHAVYLGASLNFICAIIAGFIYRNEVNNQMDSEKNTVTVSPFSWNKDFTFWAFQYAMSGFMAICFEIIWFRILDVTIKSIAMTFAIVLAIYLMSMAFGTNYGVRYLRKARTNLLAVFLKTQYFLYLYSVGAIFLFLWAVNHIEKIAFLSDYFLSYETDFQGKIVVIMYLVVPIFLMSVPTFLMGFSFTISQAIIQNNYAEVGRKVGWLQFINIVGSSAGAWFVTLIGFNVLGSSLIIKLLGIIGLFYVILIFRKKILPLAHVVFLSVVLLSVVYLLPNHKAFWEIFGGVRQSDSLILKEDDSALSSIKLNFQGGNQDVVFINGLGQSHLPFSSDEVHVALGSIPSFIHPNPEDIAIIGLGSGGTLYNVAGRPQTKRIDCFEVILSQPDVLKEYAIRKNDQSVSDILSDKRVNLILKDGRYEIQNNDKKYDLIEADALRPKSSYSGNIYSKEYFEVLKSKLKTGGIVASWMPTFRVRDTFVGVFPYVYEVGKFILIGSNQPVVVNGKILEERLRDTFTQQHFSKANIDVKKASEGFMNEVVTLRNGSVQNLDDINTDMFPKDEYNHIYKLIEQIRNR